MNGEIGNIERDHNMLYQEMEMFELINVTYARVPDYVRYLEKYPGSLGEYGDLKDVQRPWVRETVEQLMPTGGSLLDMGGSRCELASDLMIDYDVTVVDPYDGSGNGPTNPEYYRKKFPRLNIVKGLVSPSTPYPGHDAVISTSVVEHIDPIYHQRTVEGIYESLKPGGYSIHAIDVSCKGVNGFLEKTIDICQSWIEVHGVSYPLRTLVDEMLTSVDTYFLPVTMYVRWKKDRPYNAYPWRKVGSVQVVLQKQLT